MVDRVIERMVDFCLGTSRHLHSEALAEVRDLAIRLNDAVERYKALDPSKASIEEREAARGDIVTLATLMRLELEPVLKDYGWQDVRHWAREIVRLVVIALTVR